MNTTEYHYPAPPLILEEWRATFSKHCFQCDLDSGNPEVFRGRIRHHAIFDLLAATLSLNSGGLGRIHRHVRADSADYYAALITVSGRSTLTQNEHTVTLGVGDIALMDVARPLTFRVCDDRPCEWLALRLPRGTVRAHFGFEPQPGLRAAAETPVSRSLVHLMREATQIETAHPAPIQPYMQLTVYDMLGALFAKADPAPVSAHTEKLFVRVCHIIRGSFTNPDLGPSEVAAEAGISLRYLQLLFTARGTTCTHFIRSLRLDHALRLVLRRDRMSTGQPLSQIAYACGFGDYNYFARAFRKRFGHAPGAAATDSLNPRESITQMPSVEDHSS